MSNKSPRRASVQPAETLGTRGLRTRNKLKQAAKELLNEQGYRTLRVEDVTQRAEVAYGLFYRYFHDLREIAHELCLEIFKQVNEDSVALPFTLDPYDWIYEIHMSAIKPFTENPGVLACMFELSKDFDEFGDIWKASAHDWNLQVAKFLHKVAKFPKERAKQMAFVLGAMTEGVIYQDLIRHTQDLVKMGKSPEDLAEIISVMWYRAIFFECPEPSKIRVAKSLLTFNRV